MTPAELATYVRLKTRTNSNTLVDADILSLLNMRIDYVAQRATEVDEDIFLVPTYTSLVEDQREYNFHPSMLSGIKRVEAKLDGTNWLLLEEFNYQNYRKPTDETTITNEFANLEGECGFKIMRKGIVIYSGTIIDVTNGLKIWLDTWPAHVTDLSSLTDMSADPSSTTHGIDRVFHLSLADGVVIDWKGSREKPIPLDERELAYEVRLQQAISVLRKGNRDREVTGKLPGSDGTWDDGFNL